MFNDSTFFFETNWDVYVQLMPKQHRTPSRQEKTILALPSKNVKQIKRTVESITNTTKNQTNNQTQQQH